VVVLVVEVSISVYQLHDKTLYSSPPKTLHFNLCSHLLERWTARMHLIVEFLNNDVLFQSRSLRITYFHISLRNNLRKIILSFPKSKIAGITFCCIVKVSLLLFCINTQLK
jgi:hypothetical protein